MQHQRRIKPFRYAWTPVAIPVALALSFAGSATAQELPLSLCAPQSNTFSTNVDNAFFPLQAGQQWVLVG
jgi:hypothetical protein